MSVRYVSGTYTYDAEALRARCPEGPIVLTGGGNIGDVWPLPHAVRMRVIADFPDRPIIQFPQSVWFTDAAAAKTFGEAVRAHGNVTMFTRDEESHARLREQCGLESILSPDVAFALKLRRSSPPGGAIDYLLRTDKETTGSARSSVGARDWYERFTPRAYAATVFPFVARVLPSSTASSMGYAISERFLRAVTRRLSSASVVVTDRLHAGILCTLLGVPHVVIDNFYGKIHGYYRTWLSELEGAWLATSLEEASDIARNAIGGTSPR